MRLNFPAVHFLVGVAMLFALVAFSAPVLATTYYVRTDGGTAAQCNGKHDAPVSAAPNCAWSSPTVALPMGDGQYGYKAPTALIKGGDTLVIDPGSYMIGYSETPIPGTQGQSCGKGNPYECTITNIPSGIDASHPTVVTGASCSAKPELWGTQRINSIFSLSGQHDVTIACLELTDHAKCIESYKPTGTVAQGVVACDRDTYPYGEWASTGITAEFVENLTLNGLNIHGFANTGIHAGGLSGNTLLSDVTIRGNGWVGFNGDIGSDSSNSGTITIQDSSIEWNGCTEAYPDINIVGCWAQQEGGYGDGLGTTYTGGNWRILNSKFIGNTSDGLDLLYADGTGSIFIDGLTSMWNAGNQVKISGNATIQNSVVVGDCGYLTGWGAMSDGDLCRASGAALSLSVTNTNQTINLFYNTVAGSGDCIINGGTHGDFSSPNKTDTYNYQNNVFLGEYYWRAGRSACLDWYSDAASNPFTVNYLSNIVWNVKDNICPTGSICKDPQLTSEDLSTFNANPLVSSPAIGNASSKGTLVLLDYYNNSRPSQGATIGAIQFRGQAYLGSGSGDSPLPPSQGTGSAADIPARSQDVAATAAASALPDTHSAVALQPVRVSSIVDEAQRERFYRARSNGVAATPPWRRVDTRAQDSKPVHPMQALAEVAATELQAQPEAVHGASGTKTVTPVPSENASPRHVVGIAGAPAKLVATSEVPDRRPATSYLLRAYDWLLAAYRNWAER